MHRPWSAAPSGSWCSGRAPSVPLDAARTRLRSWLDDSIGIVVDADSDGLLTAALLSDEAALAPRGRQLPVVGAYDMSTLWLHPEVDLGRDAPQLIFADADVRLDGARVLSNHIITVDGRPGLSTVPAGIELCNPNYDLPGFADRSYRNKYPFSTAGWVWTLLERAPVRSSDDPLTFGLLMAQDSALENVAKYEENCLAWENRLGPGNPYAGFYREVRQNGSVRALAQARTVIAQATTACMRGLGTGVARRASGHLAVAMDREDSPSTLSALHDRIARWTHLHGSAGLREFADWKVVLDGAACVHLEVGNLSDDIAGAFSLARTAARTVTATLEWPEGLGAARDTAMAAEDEPGYET
jgi:hypothetical protein